MRVLTIALVLGIAALTATAAERDPLERLTRAAPALDRSVLELALRATSCAERRGLLPSTRTLTVIDYSRPSTESRLFVFDLALGTLVRQELVAHGRGSGDNLARAFSNRPGSYQSSLGLFVTLDPYQGEHGRSLRLEGLESGVNDRAFARAIVIHGADYVSRDFAARAGRLGRSLGCPALPSKSVNAVIDRIHGGTPVFAYYPDPAWLASSSFLGGCEAAADSGVRQLADERNQVANALVVDDAAPRRHQR
jgi:hypothetical protein